MNEEAYLTVLVLVTAVAFLLQATALVGLSLLLFKSRKPVQQILADVSHVAEIARRRADELDLTLAEISRIVRARTQQADVVSRELLDSAHSRALAADRVAQRILQEVERAADETERLIKKPFRQIHAVHAGFRAGFACLSSRRSARATGRDV